MHVLAVNASPKGEEGNTHLILAPFLDGMREAGAEVEVVYTKSLKLKPCQGEFFCMFKHPGQCFIKDDMQDLYPKFARAKVWVFATPVYCDSVTSPLKNLLDRIGPLGQPFFEQYDGHSGHPWRATTHVSQVVLVSNCGFVELDNFDPLLHQFKNLCRNHGRDGVPTEFAGALLRPNGPAVGPMKEAGVPVDDSFDAAKEARRQLVTEGKMSSETLSIVSRDLTAQSKEEILESCNEYVRQMLDGIEVPSSATG